MHTQPSAAPGRAKLTQLCWAPPVATLVEHYTGCAQSCEEVLHAAGNFNWADVAEDPLEVLSEHFDIEAEAPWLEIDMRNVFAQLTEDANQPLRDYYFWGLEIALPDEEEPGKLFWESAQTSDDVS